MYKNFEYQNIISRIDIYIFIFRKFPIVWDNFFYSISNKSIQQQIDIGLSSEYRNSSKIDYMLWAE